MAKLSRKQLEAIVKREAPGYRIARSSPADSVDAREAPAIAEDTTPDLEQLRQMSSKGGNPGTGADAGRAAPRGKSAKKKSSAPESTANDDAQIIALEPENPADPWDRGSRPKSIVVDGKGNVIGRQG